MTSRHVHGTRHLNPWETLLACEVLLPMVPDRSLFPPYIITSARPLVANLRIAPLTILRAGRSRSDAAD